MIIIYLFIISKVKDRKQTLSSFNQNITIDGYDITTGNYKFSFEIPRSREVKLYGFASEGDKLYALAKKNIFVYQMNKF
jgi:hypothetical protein